MTMTHKEALTKAVYAWHGETEMELAAAEYASFMEAAIRAYIEARGMVLVPKEPCNEMLEVYRSNVKPRPFYRTAARVVRSMLAAAPDPFKDDAQ